MKLLSKLFVPLAFCFLMLPALAQQKRTISGIVTGPDKSPLSNATVVVKGNKQGVKTNALGSFSIQVDAGPQTLVISFVGMTTTELLVDASTASVSVSMAESDATLSEVVIVSTGYQTLPKERATGTFGTVSKEQLDKPTTNISSRIIGTTSGVQALRMDEEGNPFFQIRGLSTLYSNQEPLVVVDGFPIQGSYNTVNPNDVESVTLLKDNCRVKRLIEGTSSLSLIAFTHHVTNPSCPSRKSKSDLLIITEVESNTFTMNESVPNPIHNS